MSCETTNYWNSWNREYLTLENLKDHDLTLLVLASSPGYFFPPPFKGRVEAILVCNEYICPCFHLLNNVKINRLNQH